MNDLPSPRGAANSAHLRSTRYLGALALLISVLSVGAVAQTAPAEEAAPAPAKDNLVKLETFVATGSRFNDRTVTESSVPIDVISGADLRNSGYTETNQMLQAAVPSYNFPRPTVADGTDHIRPATLRGLAPDQTLVLLNGKRRHSSALVNVNGTVGRGSVSIDLNTIPAGMIDRIEVLRDGASAQYGSDAIAGVINIILRKDQGYGFNGTYGVTKEGDGQVIDGSAWAGSTLGEGGSLFVNLFYRERENTNRSKADTRQQYFGTNTSTGAKTAISGNFASGISAPPAGVVFDPREATINRINHRHGDGDSEDTGVMFNASLPLVGGRTFYAFGGYSSRHGQAAGFFRRPGDNRTVRAIYPDGFLPLINSDINDFSMGGGLRGRGSNFDWDFSSVYGGNDFGFTISNTANVTLGAASKTVMNAGTLGFRQWTNNLDFTTTWDMNNQVIKAAYGAEFRWEGYKIKAGEPDSYRNGGILILDGPAAGSLGALGAQVFPGFRPSDAVNVSRNSYAAYVDLGTTFNDITDLSFAARFEDFSDFGSTFDVKVSGRVKAGKAVAFRGSASTGFRAPHLAQQWFSSTATNFIGGIPFENKTFPTTDPVAKLLGAVPLKAEESVNYSIGLTYQPTERFTASVDFYHIDIDDRVVLSSNFTGGPIGAFLAANGQAQANGGRYFTNAVDTRTRGVDVNARYTWNTENLGKVTATAAFNVNETSVEKIRATPTQLAGIGVTTPIFDLTERVRMEEGTPKNVVNLNANWEYQKFTVNLRNIRYGEVSQVANTSVTAAQVAAEQATGLSVRTVPSGANFQLIQDFSAKWVTDLDVTYRHNANLSVTVGANNLLDIYPDRNVTVNNNAGIFHYAGISPWGFNGTFYFGKVSYKF
ncbi:MAG: TonB-dependent receptor [Candidatus Didemnitutus sp.]|nr:TonB-dependent receptor [Candidatus Didemnitutus sp.]